MTTTNNIFHISFGLDCTIAYQLQIHSLRSCSFPFDWMKIKDINTIIDILDNKFIDFLSIDNWSKDIKEDIKEDIKDINIFNYIDDLIITENISNIKLKHKIHNILLPHESNNDICDLKEILNKYNRRINRFNNLMTNKDYKKIIYIGLNKMINNNDKYKLYTTLNNYGCINYNVHFIIYSDYIIPTNEKYSWHRNWIPWNNIFNIHH